MPDLGDQGFVPEEQDLAQRVPLPDHAAFRPGKVQVIVEGVPDLRKRQAQGVMPIGGQPQQAVADAGAGEGVFHLGFHGFLTTRTIVAVDEMFRYFRPRVGGQVFDNADADALFAVTALQGAAAVGAAVQAVFFPAVDVIGLGTVVAGMARLAARFLFLPGFLSGLGGGLEVRGNHPGRRGRRRRGGIDPPEDFQEKKQEGLFVSSQESLRQETGLLVSQGGVQTLDFT